MSLASLAQAQPNRAVAVCRELTKQFEEVVRGPAAEVADRFREAPKGEITLVVGAAAVGPTDGAHAVEAVAELVGHGVPRRRAAELVAALSGIPRNRLYRGSL